MCKDTAIAIAAFFVLTLVAGCGAGLQDRAVDRVSLADAGEDGDFSRPYSAVELRKARRHRTGRSVARTRAKRPTKRRTRRIVRRTTRSKTPVRRANSRPVAKKRPIRSPKRDGSTDRRVVAKRQVAKKPPKRAPVARKPVPRRSRPAGPATAAYRTPRAPAVIGRNAGRHRLQWAANRVGKVDKPNFMSRVMRAGGPFSPIRVRPFAKGLHRRATRLGQVVGAHGAQPGDLVFFRNTHDLNGNGRPDDGITWAGIVERVDRGRIVFIARRAGKVRRMAVTPGRPATVRADGKVLNTRLVRWPGTSSAMTSGQCFAAIARL